MSRLRRLAAPSCLRARPQRLFLASSTCATAFRCAAPAICPVIPFKPIRAFAAVSRKREEESYHPKDFVRRFLLRVHPDLFQGPDLENYRQINEESLAKLNSLMDYAEQLKAARHNQSSGRGDVTPSLASPPPDQKLTFYCLPDAEAKHYKEISAHFKPPTDIDSDRLESKLIKSVDGCIWTLVRQSGVPIPDSVVAKLNRDQAKRENQRQRQEFKKKHKVDDPTWETGWRARMRDEVFPNLHVEHRKTVDQAAKKAFIPVLFDSGFITFDESLTETQRMIGVQTLIDATEKYFDAMRCEEWMGHGIHIHQHYATPVQGRWIVAWKTNPKQVASYMHHFLPALLQQGGGVFLQTSSSASSSASPSSSSSTSSTASTSSSEPFSVDDHIELNLHAPTLDQDYFKSITGTLVSETDMFMAALGRKDGAPVTPPYSNPTTGKTEGKKRDKKKGKKKEFDPDNIWA